MPDLPGLKEIVHAIVSQSGGWAALFVIVIIWHLRYVEGQAAARLADKDAEIERLVEERNRLQDIVIVKRKSSQQKN